MLDPPSFLSVLSTLLAGVRIRLVIMSTVHRYLLKSQTLSTRIRLHLQSYIFISVLQLAPGAYLFLIPFEWGLIRGESLFEGEQLKLFDICHINGSLLKLLFSIIVKLTV